MSNADEISGRFDGLRGIISAEHLLDIRAAAENRQSTGGMDATFYVHRMEPPAAPKLQKIIAASRKQHDPHRDGAEVHLQPRVRPAILDVFFFHRPERVSGKPLAVFHEGQTKHTWQDLKSRAEFGGEDGSATATEKSAAPKRTLGVSSRVQVGTEAKENLPVARPGRRKNDYKATPTGMAPTAARAVGEDTATLPAQQRQTTAVTTPGGHKDSGAPITVAFLFLLMRSVETGRMWDFFFDAKFVSLFRIYLHQAKGSLRGWEQYFAPHSQHPEIRKPPAGMRRTEVFGATTDAGGDGGLVPATSGTSSNKAQSTTAAPSPRLFKPQIPYLVIEQQYSGWCALLSVQVALFHRALHETTNQYFVLLSQNHVPLVPFPQFVQNLLQSDKSRFCFAGRGGFDAPNGCSYAAWPQWGGRYILKHHQWAILNRKHAQKLAYDGGFTKELFSSYRRLYTFAPMCSDEVAPALALLDGKVPAFAESEVVFHENEIRQECTTFAFWKGCLYHESKILRDFVVGEEIEVLSENGNAAGQGAGSDAESKKKSVLTRKIEPISAGPSLGPSTAVPTGMRTRAAQKLLQSYKKEASKLASQVDSRLKEFESTVGKLESGFEKAAVQATSSVERAAVGAAKDTTEALKKAGGGLRNKSLVRMRTKRSLSGTQYVGLEGVADTASGAAEEAVHHQHLQTRLMSETATAVDPHPAQIFDSVAGTPAASGSSAAAESSTSVFTSSSSGSGPDAVKTVPARPSAANHSTTKRLKKSSAASAAVGGAASRRRRKRLKRTKIWVEDGMVHFDKEKNILYCNISHAFFDLAMITDPRFAANDLSEEEIAAIIEAKAISANSTKLGGIFNTTTSTSIFGTGSTANLNNTSAANITAVSALGYLLNETLAYYSMWPGLNLSNISWVKMRGQTLFSDYSNHLHSLFANSLLKPDITEDAIEKTDDAATFGVKKDTHPGTLVIKNVAPSRLVRSGYLLARKMGPFPLISFWSRSQQEELTAENLFEKLEVKRKIRTKFGLERGALEQTDTAAAGGPRGGGGVNQMKPLPLLPQVPAWMNRRIAILSGYPRTDDLFEDGNFIYHVSALWLYAWDYVEPFWATCLLWAASFLSMRHVVFRWKYYRTAFLCAVLLYGECCRVLASLLKLEGRDWILSRIEMEDL
eukprot:CAMPEP_0179006152 /NCGR_PEP_ID=MMETSP0795-20121207/14376_1 /TAXON_ID=88552 /ORGANISM="Amoebophrya sp., Strain Ameob2" /LENGTH=1157 /DNA_ID=CAMNT_0020700843 /DNA_START=76 /DNA_END=3552 /DNA_ORIENTATION=-